MLFLRSLSFNIAFYVWSIGWTLLCLVALLLPRKQAAFVQRNWSRGIKHLLAIFAAIEVKFVGRRLLDEGTVIVACKHQSAWETTVFQGLFDQPAIVMKHELSRIPIFGWYTAKMGMISVDRSRGTRAMRDMMKKAMAARDEGRKIVIFPEGTRVGSDADSDYRAGIYGLYKRLSVPVVPVALNSGRHWARRSFYRQPGVMIMEFLEPINPGLSRDDFMARLQSEIDEASSRLNRLDSTASVDDSVEQDGDRNDAS